MNIIWTLLLLSSIMALVATNPDLAIQAMIKGSHESVKLALSLLAIYGFWLGFLSMLEKLGITEKLAKILRPVIRLLFGKNISKETEKYISVNISANMLGLGNASTPMGINAIQSMDNNYLVATNNMIMLLVISATSLQLLPSTVIGLRVGAGSIAPVSFLLATTIATIVSTLLGVTLVKIFSHFFPDRQNETATVKHKSKFSILHKKNPAKK